MPNEPRPSASPLYLRDEELKQGVDLLFFASRDLFGGGRSGVAGARLGPAHARAIYFIARNPGLSVADMLAMLQDHQAEPESRAERPAGWRLRGTQGAVCAIVGPGQLRLTAKGAALDSAMWEAAAPRAGARLPRGRAGGRDGLPPRAARGWPMQRRLRAEGSAMSAAADDRASARRRRRRAPARAAAALSDSGTAFASAPPPMPPRRAR